jgi:hypothetical protein
MRSDIHIHIFAVFMSSMSYHDISRTIHTKALEVYLQNSWLTYGIGFHRVREAGMGSNIMNCLNKRPLSTSELYDWCRSMFVRDNGLVTIRHPAKDWSGFITDLKNCLKEEKLVWNPITKKLCHWIDVMICWYPSINLVDLASQLLSIRKDIHLMLADTPSPT